MFERKNPLISIIIPSWFTTSQDGKYGKAETFWLASRCLEKLIERTDREKFELIIVDNGSTLTDIHTEDLERDCSESPIMQLAMEPSAYWKAADILIRNKENLGFGPACNQAFNVARGKYIVCLNNDIVVWPEWEDKMIDILERDDLNPKPGVVMPALVKETGNAVEALNLKNIDLSSNTDAVGAGGEFGSLWMAKKETLDKVKELNGGFVFDERFKLGMGEDRWLWCQIRKLGYETYKTHKTRVFHQGNMTICKVKDRRDYTFPNRELLKKLKEE